VRYRAYLTLRQAMRAGIYSFLAGSAAPLRPEESNFTNRSKTSFKRS